MNPELRTQKSLFDYSIILTLFFMGLFGQPDQRFRAFDWVVYRDPGKITSISEGYSYTYFGSSNGGIYRYHQNGQYFDDPITMAQGLESYTVYAVHFDQNTGILWAGLPEMLQYTYTRDGNWSTISFSDLGLSFNDRIKAIGASANYLWIKAKAIYIKCDHSTGTVLGMFPFPDEGNIQWGSEYGINIKHAEKIFMDYSVMSGWMLTGQYFIDSHGRNVSITSYYLGQYNDFWVGGSDGTIFHGEPNMEVFFPYSIGPLGSNFSTLDKMDKEMWLGGLNHMNTGGITRLLTQSLEFDHFESDITINMHPMDINDILNLDDEVWFAGNQGIQLYDKDDNYWRYLGEERGIPSGNLVTLASNKTHIWVGGPNGLSRLSRKTRREDPSGIEDIFKFQNVRQLLFVDEDLWITTPNELIIFNTISPELRSFRKKGTFSLDGPFIGFRQICFDDNYLYVSTNQGILSYDYENGTWTKIIDASVYGGRTIQSMAISGEKCFLGFYDELLRIDMNNSFQKKYDFPFMGMVKDLYISGRVIWLATTEGLIKFKWSVDR